MLFYKHPKVAPKLNILVNGNPIDQVEDISTTSESLLINILPGPHILKKFQLKSQGSLAYYVS